MSQNRAEWQTKIILREQWINLAGIHTQDAISSGTRGTEIMQLVDEAAQEHHRIDTDSKESTALKRVARATSEALRHGASVEYIKSRLAVSLWRCGTLSREQASRLMHLDLSGFRKLCVDMVSAQREALRLTVDPAMFENQYR